MKKKSWISLGNIYIGTVIGAGFASGQEILKFFGVYGINGVLGGILSALFFTLIGIVILFSTFKKNINSFEELLRRIFGSKAVFINYIIISFLFISFVIMATGSGTMLYEEFGINKDIGISIFLLLIVITFFYDVKGLKVVNDILVPVLIFGISFICGMTIYNEGIGIKTLSSFNSTTITGNWITSSLLYVSYNSILIVVILSSLRPIIFNELNAIKGGIYGGLVVGILIIIVALSLLANYDDIQGVEIPILFLARKLDKKYSYIFSFVLWLAMFTTAIASYFGCIKGISKILKINEKIVSVLALLIVIPMSRLGFSNLIFFFYPLFGYLGIIVLFGMVIKLSGWRKIL